MHGFGTRSVFSLSILALLAGSACKPSEPERSVDTAVLQLEPAPPAGLTGAVTLDGSNTVAPVSQAMAEAFQRLSPGVQVAVRVSGTGGGLEKLCGGKLDIAAASRPINARESDSCQSHAVSYIELPIGFDSLSVVVSAKNPFVTCLKTDELKRMWEPAAEGKVQSWNQIRSSFPGAPLVLFGKDKESGTFDYFTLAIVGTESSSRSDYTKTEDDAKIAHGVASDPNALGYLGYAKYLASQSELKLVAVDSGKGCVLPSAATLTDGTYQPLSRPLFIYVSQAAAARPEVAAFARFYLHPENGKYLSGVGYVSLPPVGLLAAQARLSRGTLGSAFGAHGSVVGVRLDDVGEDERVKSALVQ